MHYFNGYCPECLLQGKAIAMRLNEDDFWECPESGLQIVVSPAVATILRWRGQGKFRSEAAAPPLPDGLVYAEAGKEEGKETAPDLQHLLQDDLALAWYLHEVCDSHKAFRAQQFNSHDPLFDAQRRHLEQIRPEQWQLVFESFRQFSDRGIRFNIRKDPGFRVFEQYLKQAGLVFSFNWQSWHRGWVNIRNIRFAYSKSSLLELSMYLSAIFQSEPFDEGTIEFYFNNKTLQRILQAMMEQTGGDVS